MAFLNGCQEGKATARMVDVYCPACGAEMEVFEHLGSNRAGRVEADEKCPECGHIILADTYMTDLNKVTKK